MLWGQNEPFCMSGRSWCDCERFFTTNSLITTDSKSVKCSFVGRHSADPSYTLLHQKCGTRWTNRHVNTTWIYIWASFLLQYLAGWYVWYGNVKMTILSGHAPPQSIRANVDFLGIIRVSFMNNWNQLADETGSTTLALHNSLSAVCDMSRCFWSTEK
jgi:hypothetical protein